MGQIKIKYSLTAGKVKSRFDFGFHFNRTLVALRDLRQGDGDGQDFKISYLRVYSSRM
jgi:hypothetical protein